MYRYLANIVRVVDGDTVEVDIDLGLRITMAKVKVRLVGPKGRRFDAPELNEAGGAAARDSLRALLPQRVLLETFKPDARDSFGRWLACIYVEDNVDAATLLVLEENGKWS